MRYLFLVTYIFTILLLSYYVTARLAKAFYYVLRLFGKETRRQRDGGNRHVAQTYRLVAASTREVNVSVMVVEVGAVAHTVFLRARAVVNLMHQMMFREEGKCAKNGRSVKTAYPAGEVGDRDNAVRVLADGTQYHDTNGRWTNTQ